MYLNFSSRSSACLSFLPLLELIAFFISVFFKLGQKILGCQLLHGQTLGNSNPVHLGWSQGSACVVRSGSSRVLMATVLSSTIWDSQAPGVSTKLACSPQSVPGLPAPTLSAPIYQTSPRGLISAIWHSSEEHKLWVSVLSLLCTNYAHKSHVLCGSAEFEKYHLACWYQKSHVESLVFSRHPRNV